MLTRGALASVGAGPAASAGLAGSPLYEIVQPGQQPLGTAGARPVVIFASAAQLVQEVSAGLPAGTYGVLYDPEAWPFTPRAEQADPVAAAWRARRVAHAHGLSLFVAPALNLASAQPGRGDRWVKFLRAGLAGHLARAADVIVLQAQSLERDTATYTAFVRAAAHQARVANPGVRVLAGLSTNPPGPAVTADHLAAAVLATRRVVSGYWLNIPGPGPRCPTCNNPRPELARQLLGL
jgi:hypothetical protein